MFFVLMQVQWTIWKSSNAI